MMEFIGAFIIGIICIVLGISNMRGNISSLHYYHRRRVTEEDRLPFGRLVGLGTMIIGCSVMLFACLSAAAAHIAIHALTIIASVFLIVGLVAGIGMMFYAMIKYNKGIF